MEAQVTPGGRGRGVAVRKRAAGAVAALAVAALAGGTLWNAILQHDRAVAGAYETTDSLAHTIEAHASDLLRRSELLLSGIAEVLARVPEPEWPQEAQPLLKRRHALVPQLGSVFLVDASGRIVARSTDSLGFDVSDRPYFQEHSKSRDVGMLLHKPMRSRVSGNWIAIASRRLERPDGSFAGVVGAALDLSSIASFYRSVGVGQDSSVLLLFSDGTVAVREPGLEDFVGTSVAEHELFRRAQADPELSAGHGPTTSPFDRQGRLVSWKTSQSYPVLAVVSKRTATVLRNWREQAWIAGVSAAAGAVLVCLLLWLWVRWAERREAMIAALVRAKDAAETANLAKTRFLASMSHDLRTPLNAVIGFSEVLETGVFGALSPKQSEYLRDIRSSGCHLLDLIGTILDVAKVEAGKWELRPERVDAAEVGRECLRQVCARAAAKRVQVRMTVAGSGSFVVADRRALGQILLNLLTNAVKFTGADGLVQLNVGTDGDNVFIRVSDTGCGIPTPEIERLMEPFQQAQGNYLVAKEGTGLGLYIVRSLAELHGGSAVIESTVGAGTTVTVTLPVCPKGTCESYGQGRCDGTPREEGQCEGVAKGLGEPEKVAC